MTSARFDTDVVKLRLGGDELLIAESYTVNSAVLTQPSSFDVTFGWSKPPVEFIKKYPPNTKFELLIGDRTQQIGFTDGQPEVSEDAGSTRITVRGRDISAPIHDNYVVNEKSFNDVTYADLVRHVLKENDLDPSSLITSDAANLSAKAGVPIRLLDNSTAPTVNEVVEQPDASSTTPGAKEAVIQCKLGSRWYEWLRRFLERAGLVLWASVDGLFVLSTPTSQQDPIYRIVRGIDDTAGKGNVIRSHYASITTGRYTTIVAYGHGGRGKGGYVKSKGDYVDDEMFNWGYTRKVMTVRDMNSQNVDQASFFARRKAAEQRRAGFHLEYTLSGHSTPALSGGVAVWTPNTCVEVQDDRLGLSGKFYIESCRYERRPFTTTTVRLMRPIDLIFGGD